MTRRLTNQDAFDGAMLHLLNQGHSCLSASGHARYRGPRGKSAIGALIPDELYITSMEGKKLRQLLAPRASEYDALREHLGGCVRVTADEAVNEGGRFLWHTTTVAPRADGALTTD